MITYTGDTGTLTCARYCHITTDWKARRAELLISFNIVTPCYWHVIDDPASEEKYMGVIQIFFVRVKF